MFSISKVENQLRYELSNSLAEILQGEFKVNHCFIEPHILLWKNLAFGYEKMPSMNHKKINNFKSQCFAYGDLKKQILPNSVNH